MCIEDVRLGRKKATRTTFVDFAATPSGVTINASNSRTHIAFYRVAFGAWQARPESVPAGITAGFWNINGSIPFEYSVEEYGTLVTGSWILTLVDPGAQLFVVETFLEER